MLSREGERVRNCPCIADRIPEPFNPADVDPPSIGVTGRDGEKYDVC
jgi:hypothetical protein